MDLHTARWIRKLLKAGQRPDIHVLCEVPKSDWARVERAFIEVGRQYGFDLTNTSDGGEGTSLPGAKNPNFGKPMSKATRAKISVGNLGTKHTPEFGAACGLRFRGKKRSPESVAKGAAKQRGQIRPPLSPEHRAKIGSAFKGRKLLPEHCAKISGALKGKTHLPEHHAKIIAAKKGKIQKNNTSGFIGVSQSPSGKWRATFRARRGLVHVGLFSKVEDAVFARNLAIASLL